MLRSVSILLAAGYLLAAGVWILSSGVVRRSSGTELINVACDPTRELWDELNPKFCASYEARTGTPVAIRNSHGGSASQAWQVKNGFEADVVTLAMWPDTDAIRKAGLMDDGWETKLDGGSLPYISTIVFVVRTGSEKTRDLRNWEDLIARDDIRIIVPNPKTSGNGKWAFLAAWGSVKRRGGSDAEAEEFVKRLFQRTNGLDPSARAATENFAKNGQGDVHLTWENEAHLEVNPSGGKLKLINPPYSVRAEPHVAVVDSVARKKGTAAAAKAYLEFLHTEEAQRVIAKHYYRPTHPDVARETVEQFDREGRIELFPVVPTIGASWDGIDTRFFVKGGIFDRIYDGGKSP